MMKWVFVVTVLLSTLVEFVAPHEEGRGAGSCSAGGDARIPANYGPGVITLDGRADDWSQVNGFDFSLLPALDPNFDNSYEYGKMNVKALHDGREVFFLLQVDGIYAYSKGKEGEDDDDREDKEDEHDDDDDDDDDKDSTEDRKEPKFECGFQSKNDKCPSVAIMFKIGEKATYHNMGGCEQSQDACNSKNCRGHEVDIIHFSTGSAVPGRLYGGNSVYINGSESGRNRLLVDLYAWTPHCRFPDGTDSSGIDSTSLNNWKGVWWHDSLNHSGLVEDDHPFVADGGKGTFTFELSRPLRTMDRLQQDVQFTIGQPSKMAVAFWYPIDGKPWQGYQHYSINCDWVLLDIAASSGSLTRTGSNDSWNPASVFSLITSVLSFCVSVFIGYWVSRTKDVPFTRMEIELG